MRLSALHRYTHSHHFLLKALSSLIIAYSGICLQGTLEEHILITRYGLVCFTSDQSMLDAAWDVG